MTMTVEQILDEFGDQFVVELTESVMYGTARWYKEEFELCESPIERMFLMAFVIVNKMSELHLVIEPQVAFGHYRVDFVVSYKERTCIVECDGRDYHHSTWQQIEQDRQRDQELELLGHKVFRFPGRQIRDDPITCLQTVRGYFKDRIAADLRNSIQGAVA